MTARGAAFRIACIFAFRGVRSVHRNQAASPWTSTSSPPATDRRPPRRLCEDALREAAIAPGAAELMAQALELARNGRPVGSGWRTMKRNRANRGSRRRAAHTLRLNPEDIFGASLKARSARREPRRPNSRRAFTSNAFSTTMPSASTTRSSKSSATASRRNLRP